MGEHTGVRILPDVDVAREHGVLHLVAARGVVFVAWALVAAHSSFERLLVRAARAVWICRAAGPTLCEGGADSTHKHSLLEKALYVSGRSRVCILECMPELD